MSYLQHHGMIPCYLQLASKLSITWNGFQAKTTLASHPCYYYPDISMVIQGCIFQDVSWRLAIDGCKMLQPFPVPKPDLTRVLPSCPLQDCSRSSCRWRWPSRRSRGRPRAASSRRPSSSRGRWCRRTSRPTSTACTRRPGTARERTALSTSPGNSSHSQTNTSYSSAYASSLNLIPLICIRDATVSPVSS